MEFHHTLPEESNAANIQAFRRLGHPKNVVADIMSLSSFFESYPKRILKGPIFLRISQIFLSVFQKVPSFCHTIILSLFDLLFGFCYQMCYYSVRKARGFINIFWISTGYCLYLHKHRSQFIFKGAHTMFLTYITNYTLKLLVLDITCNI